MKTRKMVKMAMIVALYVAVTFAVAPIAFGPIQYRISEALTILPIFGSMYIWAVTFGCFLANLLGAFLGFNAIGLVDMFVGTLATLIAAVMTYYIANSKKKWVRYIIAPFPAVIVNSIIIGLEITYIYSAGTIWFNCASVFIGQFVVCYFLGVPLLLLIEKNKILHKLFVSE